MLSRNNVYISGMKIDTNIFKIESNNILPSRGRTLISEPFLQDKTFGRSVILLVEHSSDGSMGLVMNKRKPYPIFLNRIVKELVGLEQDIPIFEGGPMGTDTLFYLHTIEDISGALPIKKGLFLNGDFSSVKRYLLEGNPVTGVIRFFLGYSGWEGRQLEAEIESNSWMIGNADIKNLLTGKVDMMWKQSMKNLGTKYSAWSRFPLIPSMN